MKLEMLAGQVEEVCHRAGHFIQNEKAKVSHSDIELKGLNSLVSYVDKQAEEMLVKGLSDILPEAGFITEEETPDQRDKRYKWIIDPLDGTTNYLHGIPVYAVSVALMDESEVLAGVVYELGQDEMFTAWKGGGAYLDGRPIKVKSGIQLKDSLLATGFPYHDFDHMQPFMKMLQELFEKTRGVRRLGSAATDLAYVACGRFDGFFESGLSPWDVAAGVLLVQEAGGKVSDFSRGSDFIHGGEIVACCPSIEEEFMKLVEENLSAR